MQDMPHDEASLHCMIPRSVGSANARAHAAHTYRSELGNSAFAEVRNLRLAAVAEYKICIHSFRHMFALLYQKTPGFIGCISPYLLLLFLSSPHPSLL